MAYSCNPDRWIGLCFVASHWNCSGEQLAQIAGVEVAAPQVVWGEQPPPGDIRDKLYEYAEAGLRTAGWGWCDAGNQEQAQTEGRYHAEVALDLGLQDFIANMEASYDAGGNQGDQRFWMPGAYFEAFRDVAPEVELALTTTPLWASDHAACRRAGCVLMQQAFPLDNKVTVAQAAHTARCGAGRRAGYDRWCRCTRRAGSYPTRRRCWPTQRPGTSASCPTRSSRPSTIPAARCWRRSSRRSGERRPAHRRRRPSRHRLEEERCPQSSYRLAPSTIAPSMRPTR